MFNNSNISKGIEILSIPFDHSKWDYSQLTDPNNFQWKVGITPFSNLQ
ncbi:8732_t:CDS:1, partial [Racocetra fulgida]